MATIDNSDPQATTLDSDLGRFFILKNMAAEEFLLQITRTFRTLQALRQYVHDTMSVPFDFIRFRAQGSSYDEDSRDCPLRDMLPVASDDYVPIIWLTSLRHQDYSVTRRHDFFLDTDYGRKRDLYAQKGWVFNPISIYDLYFTYTRTDHTLEPVDLSVSPPPSVHDGE